MMLLLVNIISFPGLPIGGAGAGSAPPKSAYVANICSILYEVMTSSNKTTYFLHSVMYKFCLNRQNVLKYIKYHMKSLGEWCKLETIT
jgi:hypothetical protein